MKIWTCSVFWAVIFAASIITPAFADNEAGKIKTLKGEVSIIRAGSSIHATSGMMLIATDKITTGPNSSVGITMRDGTLLSLGANSVSQLNEYKYDPANHEGNMLVSVTGGTMRFVSGLIGKHNPSAVAIHTTTAIIGLRGTDFIVSVEGGSN